MIGKQHKLVKVRSNEECNGCFFFSDDRPCPRHKGSGHIACISLSEKGYTEFFNYTLEIL
jgi:hypothetical protein